MSSLTINATTAHSATRSPDTVATTQKSSVNYLNRSIEFMKPGTESQHRILSTVWTVAAYVSVAAFAAISIAGIVLSGIFSPIAIPFVALGIFALLNPVWSLYDGLNKRSDHELQQADRSKTIREISEKLPTDKTAFLAELGKIGIQVNQLDPETRADVTQLRPLLANYLFWANYSKDLDKAANETRQKSVDHMASHPTEHDVIEDFRLKCIALEESSLIAKTNASFYFGLLKQPKFSKEFSDVVSFTELPLDKRALAARFNDPKAEEFFQINGTTPVSYAQVRGQSIPELSTRIFA